GYAEAAVERQPFRETHLSFFQDGFDESRGDGIGARRGGGRRGRFGGRADHGTRPGGTQMAFGTRCGYLCDVAAAAKAGAGAGSAVDDDGGTFRTYRSA